jgi:hypothetical protein
MKLEGELVIDFRGVKMYRCTRPDFDCIWSVSRDELVEAERLGGRPTSDIPQFKGTVCNCNPFFPAAVDEARRIGCGLLKQ